MKKTVSLVAIILMIIYSVLLFVPCIYTMKGWRADTPGVGIYTLKWNHLISITSSGFVLTALIILCAAASIVVFILHISESEIEFLDKLTYMPIATGVMFIVAAMIKFSEEIPDGEPGGTATSGYFGYTSFGSGWGFYVELMILIVCSVISYLIATGRIANETSTNKKEVVVHESNADELKKYKELLDDGAITQEEYDTKKKEILRL